MNVVKFSTGAPTFDFISFFEGHRRASGWFSDRFGNVKRHFSGDFFGTLGQDGSLRLDETLIYSDGLVETRQWNVTVSDEGVFHAESDSLIGSADGIIVGDALNMKYVMKVQIDAKTVWKLSMNDFMFLQPDGSLHNMTHVKKYGFRIGTVSTQYFRPNTVVTDLNEKQAGTSGTVSIGARAAASVSQASTSIAANT